jgi:hypothetical protein
MLGSTPIADKLVLQTTDGFSLFHRERNFSQIFRTATIPLSQDHTSSSPYVTREMEGATLPQQVTFLNAYKILLLSILPSKK